MPEVNKENAIIAGVGFAAGVLGAAGTGFVGKKLKERSLRKKNDGKKIDDQSGRDK